MLFRGHSLRWTVVCGFLMGASWHASSRPVPAHFEGRQTHPIGLTPDGHHLLAVHTPASRLSVFDVTRADPSVPLLVAEIPVGLEPVSVRARTDDEVWVVNEVSDSVSVVSLRRRLVVSTLPCPDEPADVVFAGGKAFVSCARNSVLRVFDAELRTEIAVIPLEGVFPRALTATADGTRVFAAFQLSGNRTTVLPPSKAAPQPAPANPDLPAPPSTAEIVAADDARVAYTVLDHDVAEVSVSDLKVQGYLSDVGTCLFDLAVRPGVPLPELWVANTEARNRVRFEENLNGHIADNRLTRVSVDSGAVTPIDLNPGVDYGVLPNPAAQAVALAQPTAVVFSAAGATGWVAAFGSDRVARFDPADGTLRAWMDVRTPVVGSDALDSSRRMRGPRGLALHEGHERLYVLNKLTDSITVIGSRTDTVESEVPLGTSDPLSPAVRAGRGVLFDARLSGNGLASCATCHPDADRDGLAWDLGNPSGEMQTVMGANLSVHDLTLRPRLLHPMKGPMVTQTLRGLVPGQPLHWRGDRATLGHFNVTFPDLLGAPPRPVEEINALQAYLDTLRHPPNPHRNADDTLPTRLNGGNPVKGRTLFNVHINHCSVCHVLPGGTDQNLDDPRNFGGHQPMKTPSLQTVYQRATLDSRPGAVSRAGFGLGHDGTGGNQSLPTIHFYELDLLTGTDFADVSAFVLCFDTGTAPAVGRSRTVTADLAGTPEVAADLALLETQAVRTNGCDLVVHGRWRGEWRQFLFDPVTFQYREDRHAGVLTPVSRRELLSGLEPQDALTFLGTLPGEGERFGRDGNRNGIPDGDEAAPPLRAEAVGNGVRLSWPSVAADWLLEWASTPAGPWLPEYSIRSANAGSSAVVRTFDTGAFGFFRLRRVW